MPMSSRHDAGVTKRGVRGEEATRAAIANVVTAKSDLPSECQRLHHLPQQLHIFARRTCAIDRTSRHFYATKNKRRVFARAKS